MTLLNAPVYDEHKENLKKTLLIGSAVLVGVLFVLTFAGFFLGHGWLFSDLPAEHTVDKFFDALEAKDYDKAFAVYNNDANWKQHPEKYADYPLARFTDDWTTDSPINGPIVKHHVYISKPDGSGYFGTGIIVAVSARTATGPEKKLFVYYLRAGGNLTYPSFHILEY